MARTADGSLSHPLGAGVSGLLVYSVGGYMTAQLMAAGRPQWPCSADPERLDTIAAISEGYVAYAGTFEVHEEASAVSHHVTMSLLPDWVGGVQHRLVELDGDRLILSVAGAAPGDAPTHRLTWRRVPERP